MTAQLPLLDFQQLPVGLKQARFFIHSQEQTLCSGIKELDACFGEAIRPGKIIEWGLPNGRQGRLLPLTFLNGEIPPSIWIYADNGTAIYAPAWLSYGVDLQRLFFIRSSHPVKELRPLFLDNLFKIIVIDCPKDFLKGDLAFIHHRARLNQQIIFLIRNYFLSAKNGNPLATVRLNGWQNQDGRFFVNVIKGKVIGKKEIRLVQDNQ